MKKGNSEKTSAQVGVRSVARPVLHPTRHRDTATAVRRRRPAMFPCHFLPSDGRMICCSVSTPSRLPQCISEGRRDYMGETIRAGGRDTLAQRCPKERHVAT